MNSKRLPLFNEERDFANFASGFPYNNKYIDGTYSEGYGP